MVMIFIMMIISIKWNDVFFFPACFHFCISLDKVKLNYFLQTVQLFFSPFFHKLVCIWTYTHFYKQLFDIKYYSGAEKNILFLTLNICGKIWIQFNQLKNHCELTVLLLWMPFRNLTNSHWSRQKHIWLIPEKIF